MVADHGVQAMFTAPTAIRAIKKNDPDGELMPGSTTCRRSTRCSWPASGSTPTPTSGRPQLLGVPVVDNWWQTETGLADRREPAWAGTAPDQAGVAVRCRCRATTCASSATGRHRGPGREEGAICLRLPLPPGTLPTLWGDDDRYVSGYLSAFDGYYLTGDGGYLDEDGYLFVLGRTDDVINVAGHRLSTGTIEAALAGHPAVAECAVIGVADDLKGQVPRALVVLKAGVNGGDGDGSAPSCKQRVRAEVGAIASLQRVDVVAALPKTRSGKILRKTMREMADGKNPVVPVDDRGRLGP